jgi:hypothetical protein
MIDSSALRQVINNMSGGQYQKDNRLSSSIIGLHVLDQCNVSVWP